MQRSIAHLGTTPAALQTPLIYWTTRSVLERAALSAGTSLKTTPPRLLSHLVGPHAPGGDVHEVISSGPIQYQDDRPST